MTREEAIERLKTMRWEHATNSTNPDHEAFDMAIEALSTEPCEDTISRQAAQDYIAKYLSQDLYYDVREAVEVIDEYIGDLPPVTPKQKG